MDRLKTYRWPGNVRELENLVRRLAALHAEEIVGVEAIEPELADSTVAPGEIAEDKSGSLSQSVERHLAAYFSAHGGGLPPAGLYLRVLQEIERPLIALTLKATRGNQVRTADLLGLNRNTLRKKIRDIHVTVTRGGAK